MPDNCLLATVLQQPDLERARDLIAGSPRARGSNHLLCDAGGRIWDVETTAERWAFVDGAPLFTHANHYVSPELAPDDASGSEGSPKRRARAEELLKAGVEAGTDLVELGKAVLSDHAERAVQHLRALERRRPRRGPERDHGEHGVGAGGGPRPHRLRAALFLRIRDLPALSRARGRVPQQVRQAGRHMTAAVDLYWIPLGAGGHLVRLNGKVYERLVAWRERRAPLDLYHAALVVTVPEGRFAIESTPVPDASGHERGVVAGGSVGSRWAGAFRIFRYEVRCWRDGVIPDLAWAVESPRRLTDDEIMARRVLEVAPLLPTPVWGRDELGTGEMWNSNSIVAWLLARAGFDMPGVGMPKNGRAPGWDAGVLVAGRPGGR